MEFVAYVREAGDRVYLQSPVGPYSPAEEESKRFAFASEVTAEAARDRAPNPKIMWMRGQYVEADNANENGDQWTAGDIAIKRLTPVLMPVTLMHDFSTNIGVIADTALRLPKDDPAVIRPRIDNVLALWAHRYPDVAEEAAINAQQGTCMQSMECLSPTYDCSVCGMNFVRQPRGAEREHWCSHLRGETTASDGRSAARILRDVIFTGSGLILGTRGAHGAYREAFLEVEALAEFHAKIHERPRRKDTPRRKNFMELDDARYAELVAQAEKGKRIDTIERELSDLKASVADKDKSLEQAEAAKVKAEQERDEEKTKREQAEEERRAAALSAERFEALGSGFKEKLDAMPTTKTRLADQAKTLSDDDWKARLEELKEATGVDPTAQSSSGSGGGGADNTSGSDATAGLLFDRETVARSNTAGGSSPSNEPPSDAARETVLGSLFSTRKKTAGAAK